MTDRYAVIGNPIAHSKSPTIQVAFAASTGQDMSYERLLAPLDGFRATVERFAAEGGLGLNVTIPFKLEAFELATETTQRARLAGAVNTLKRIDGGWLADNTDGADISTTLTAAASSTRCPDDRLISTFSSVPSERIDTVMRRLP